MVGISQRGMRAISQPAKVAIVIHVQTRTSLDARISASAGCGHCRSGTLVFKAGAVAFDELDGHRPHSSSASRFTAGAPGFLLLIQSGERPER